MRRLNNRLLPMAVTGLMMFCSAAVADLSIDFSDGNSFSDTFSMTQGESLAIGVYLSETGTTILDSPGWGGFEIQATPLPTTIGTIGSTSIDAAFNVSSDDSTATLVDLSGAVFGAAAPTGSPILLGSFTFTTASVGSTVFSFADSLPGVDGWADGGGTFHDTTIFGANQTDTYSLTINSTAIPEPSSMFLMGVSGVCVTLRRRRNRS